MERNSIEKSINEKVRSHIVNTGHVNRVLHKYFYSKPEIISELMNDITQHFPVFNIDYNELNKCIELKIKKTTMKKLSSYECTSRYYYNTLTPIFMKFYERHLNELVDAFMLEPDDKNLDDTAMDTVYNYLLTEYAMSQFRISIILDNIIIIRI